MSGFGITTGEILFSCSFSHVARVVVFEPECRTTGVRFMVEEFESVAREIGQRITSYKVIVTKSTVPVGTSEIVRGWIQEELDARGEQARFSVASNPEFLREGAAVGDFMRPDRVVIGTDTGDDQALAILKDLYRPLFLNETPFVETNIPTAELSKYAANAFLATKISFINEVSVLCEEVGVDAGRCPETE